MPATEMKMLSLMPSLLLPLELGLLLGLHSAHTNVIDEKCRQCICANTYGRPGNAEDCQMRPYGDCFLWTYCGPYDMSELYWWDAGAPGGHFLDCMADWACANHTLDAYIDRYCTIDIVGHDPPCSCEEQARIHHCGPLGIYTEQCDKAWQLYAKCLAN